MFNRKRQICIHEYIFYLLSPIIKFFIKLTNKKKTEKKKKYIEKIVI